MSDDDEPEAGRIIAACERCGSVYAALHRSDDEIIPIGSRRGCASCGGTTFAPVAEVTDDSVAGDDD